VRNVRRAAVPRETGVAPAALVLDTAVALSATAPRGVGATRSAVASLLAAAPRSLTLARSAVTATTTTRTVQVRPLLGASTALAATATSRAVATRTLNARALMLGSSARSVALARSAASPPSPPPCGCPRAR
jgi:hypothetical protein